VLVVGTEAASAYPTPCYKEILVSLKRRVILSRTLSKTLNLANFPAFLPRHFDCCNCCLLSSSVTLTVVYNMLAVTSPFPQIDIIGAVMIVWRVRGKTIRSVLCNIVCNNCAVCDAHTYGQTNSSLDWVLSHWAHFTVLTLLCITVCCMHA